MSFPKKTGIIELYSNKSKLPSSYMEYLCKITPKYFPEGLLEITVLDPIRVGADAVRTDDAFSLLADLRKINNLDILGGLSSDVFYFDKYRKVPMKINEARPEQKVVICGNRHPTKATMPRLLGHEFGHILGLDHDDVRISYRIFLTLARGFKLNCVLDFAEKNGIIDDGIESDLMVKNLNLLKTDGFSERNYEYLANLMKNDNV